MAENDIYIAGLGPGVPEWSNEITQQQILDALRSGFGGTDSSNQQIVAALGKISTGDKSAESTLKELLGSNEKITNAIEQNTANEKTSEMKTMSIFSSMKDLLISGNKIAREQTEQLKRDKAFERNVKQKMSKDGGGKSEAEARMAASFDTVSQNFKEAKDSIVNVVGILSAAYSGSKAMNAMVREGADQRFDMAQEIRQSGLMAGMDTASAGLINLSKTISGANFTFGEAQQFTQQFAQAVGVRGVEASMLFSNQLAQSGKDGGNMMQRYGMEFREVAEIAGTYMESLRTIGQLDQLSDTQMRSGMDDFMKNVVSTSNTMNINLQDAANMIKDTLKQDKFASMLALLEPDRRETVTAMVGKFGGDQTMLGQGIGTALAAGSTQEFLMTEIGQMLQGDVIGQQLIPIITKLADVGRTQGTDAAMEMYSQLGPQLQGLIEFGKDNKALVLTNSGNSQLLIAQAAELQENINKANAGEIGLTAEDNTAITAKEIFRQQVIAGESVQNVLIESADIAENLGELNAVLLNKTNELRKMGTGLAQDYGGALMDVTTGVESIMGKVGVGLLSVANKFVGTELPLNANTEALRNLAEAMGANIEDNENIKEAKSLRSESIKKLENAKLLLEKNESGQNTGGILNKLFSFSTAEEQAEEQRKNIAKLEATIRGYNDFISGKATSLPVNPEDERQRQENADKKAQQRAEKSAKLQATLLDRVQNIEYNDAKIESLKNDIEAINNGTDEGGPKAKEKSSIRAAELKISELEARNASARTEIENKSDKLTADDLATLTEALTSGLKVALENNKVAPAPVTVSPPDRTDAVAALDVVGAANAEKTNRDAQDSSDEMNDESDAKYAFNKKIDKILEFQIRNGELSTIGSATVSSTMMSTDHSNAEEVLSEIRKDNTQQIQDKFSTTIAKFDFSRQSSIEKLLKNSGSLESNRAETIETLKQIKNDGDLEIFKKLLKALEDSKKSTENINPLTSPSKRDLTSEEKVYNNDISRLVTELRGLVKALN